jgi:hypothetical protein
MINQAYMKKKKLRGLGDPFSFDISASANKLIIAEKGLFQQNPFWQASS